MPAAIAEIKQIHGTWTGKERMHNLLTNPVATGDRELLYLLDKEIAYNDGIMLFAQESGDLFIILYLISRGVQPATLMRFVWNTMNRDIFDLIFDRVKNIHQLIVTAIEHNYESDLILGMIERGNWSEDLEHRALMAGRHLLAQNISMFRPAQ